MTDDVPASAPVGERLTFALRQWAWLGFALLVAGLVTEQLRPDETLDRGIASTAFLWAIVLWLAALVFGALAFDDPQDHLLDTKPLLGAAAISTVIFLIGLVTLDGGTFARRVLYLLATGLGAVMFWWAVLSIGYLVIQRLR